ncbi:hypothetical protein, partial [Ruegeria faecimaris]|uniref:hypothetical protein n=1 Tax=Ruegeria faecimaris TaxID=686389 RepID=UPI001C8F4144
FRDGVSDGRRRWYGNSAALKICRWLLRNQRRLGELHRGVMERDDFRLWADPYFSSTARRLGCRAASEDRKEPNGYLTVDCDSA